jgi:hypothetical protein
VAISTTSVPAWDKSLGRLRGTYFSFDSPFFFKQFKKPATRRIKRNPESIPFFDAQKALASSPKPLDTRRFAKIL